MGEIELMPERKASGEEEDQEEGEERGNGKQGKVLRMREKRNVYREGITGDRRGAQPRGSMRRMLNVQKGRNEGQEMTTSRSHVICPKLQWVLHSWDFI